MGEKRYLHEADMRTTVVFQAPMIGWPTIGTFKILFYENSGLFRIIRPVSSVGFGFQKNIPNATTKIWRILMSDFYIHGSEASINYHLGY